MSAADTYHTRVRAVKRAIIADTLRHTDGNVSAAARSLGLQRTYLHRLLRTLSIARPEKA